MIETLAKFLLIQMILNLVKSEKLFNWGNEEKKKYLKIKKPAYKGWLLI